MLVRRGTWEMRHPPREPFDASYSVTALCRNYRDLCGLSVDFTIRRRKQYTNKGYAPRTYNTYSESGLFVAIDGEVAKVKRE